jgi:3-isopropylmalate dehydrogenase
VWSRLVGEVAREFPDVTVDYLHVDAATIFLTTDPGRFDVIVTDNLFGDIITDLAAAITGGIGLAASGNVNPDRTFPSMFEPVHGSAPDIAGTGTANPTAMFLSAVMMLEWLAERHGLPACNEAAEVLRSAVERPFQQGRIKPFEFGGSSGTAEITRAVVDALRVNAREH